MNKEPVIDSSGNVFADLGFSAEESTLLAMRAELMTRLRDTSNNAAGCSKKQRRNWVSANPAYPT